MSNETVATGAWGAYADLSKEAKAVFDGAMAGLVGVKYTPLAYASQVVAGRNFSFFCNAMGVYPGATNQAAIVDIYQEPNGVPKVTEVRIMKP